MSLPFTASVPRPKARNLSQAAQLFYRVVECNDQKAFGELFEQFYKESCQYAQRMVQIPEIAEELVADVFIRIWHQRQRIVIHTSFKAYLYKAVHNQALDYLRSQHARQSQRFEEVKPGQIPTLENPEQAFMGQEMHLKITQAIAGLAPQARHIFQLSRDEGLKYREIAEKLSLSIKTVETQMGRALKSLRQSLA
ncbi:MAG: RNA polymerase sigma-70 factor [Microscillaceae bacterium]|nr:RNA polymerase sigma-70 factor [Microscillaceae bacterium]